MDWSEKFLVKCLQPDRKDIRWMPGSVFTSREGRGCLLAEPSEPVLVLLIGETRGPPGLIG